MVNEPKILGFLCNWCCYAAADSAGIARFQYPPNIRVIRVMCTGRIDPVFFCLKDLLMELTAYLLAGDIWASAITGLVIMKP